MHNSSYTKQIDTKFKLMLVCAKDLDFLEN